MLSKYIKNLLKTQNRVIVPELGAFLQKDDALKTIYFNEFLKFNDELLINYISDQEHIDKTDAARIIKSFNKDVQEKLKKDRTIILEEIGNLYLDKNDKIQLKSSFSFALHSDNGDKVWKKKSLTTNSDHELKIDDFNFDKPKEQHIADTDNENFKTVFSSRRVVFIFGLFLILLAAAYFLFFQPIKESQSNFGLSSDSLKLNSTGHSSSESIYKRANKNENIGSLKKEMEGRPVGSNGIKANDIASKEAVSNNNKIKAEIGNDSNKTFSKKPFSSSINNTRKKYYIIAGSFTQEGNADSLLRKLNSEGYNAEKLTMPAGIFYVSYNSFSSKDLANMEIKRLKTIGISGTWLYYY